MSETVKVSLVIVSQERPEQLSLLIESLRHQTHQNFEVVVVADAKPGNCPSEVKYIPFQIPNISAARNEGIRHSAGEVIAFCDDDAIPDPPWLERLVAPFTDKAIGSTTGFTRGRNGISRQWGAMRFDAIGVDHPFEIDETGAFEVFEASPTNPVKLLGTNMAIRKSALVDIGGFDESFRFFLDETDVKLRLDQAGWKSAIAPNAQVHHKFAASIRRKSNRTPTSLFEIGASKAHFCKKHSEQELEHALHTFANEQLVRLFRLVADHKLKKPKLKSLMKSLNEGFVDGKSRTTEPNDLRTNESEFRKFKTNNGNHVVICAGPRDTSWMRQTVREQVSAGNCVSVIQLKPSPRYFQVNFVDGYWLHKGGTYGKSIRTQRVLQFTTASKRLAAEVERISALYPVDTILSNS